jgi:hypothetical protein
MMSSYSTIFPLALRRRHCGHKGDQLIWPICLRNVAMSQ